MCVQSMPDTSPTKWHLAHTTWFFEAVVLPQAGIDYEPFDHRFAYLFNSYYEALGDRHPRSARGLITRPSTEEVMAYRRHVDAAIERVFDHASEGHWNTVLPLLVLGIHHEQQHQELLATDILHLFSCNPLMPAWQAAEHFPLRLAPTTSGETNWVRIAGGIREVGHVGSDGSAAGFAFDNETPRHRVLLAPYEIASTLVSCGEFLSFVEDGGYRRPELWLSDGWAAVKAGGWRAPAYWVMPDVGGTVPSQARSNQGRWQVFGTSGLRPFDSSAPVTQLSFYEAAAYAQWAGARLPTEQEWECAADAHGIRQMHGHAWQWTRSSYDPYPGFRALTGVAEEYNGKFMVGQVVLRGSSAWTPRGHSRDTYRNFFPPSARWQFSGLRLARDVS